MSFALLQPVGCDWKLNSEAVEDVCGDCDGDGTHCTVVEAVYTEVGKGIYATPNLCIT